MISSGILATSHSQLSAYTIIRSVYICRGGRHSNCGKIVQRKKTHFLFFFPLLITHPLFFFSLPFWNISYLALLPFPAFSTEKKILPICTEIRHCRISVFI
jgi:hypothetical protein